MNSVCKQIPIHLTKGGGMQHDSSSLTPRYSERPQTALAINGGDSGACKQIALNTANGVAFTITTHVNMTGIKHLTSGGGGIRQPQY